MKHARWMRLGLGFGLVVALALGGCAKKPVPVPPPAPPAPAPTTPEAPPPTPPQPSEPVTSIVGAGDFQPVFFDFDSYTLNDTGRGALDADARLLRDNADVRVVIEGHCDERGTVEYNQALGERRAQAARDYLVAAGIADSRLRTVSYGKERPFDLGHDEAAWAKNRRAHFTLQ